MVCVDIGQTASRSLIVYHQGPATNRSNTPSITEQLGTLHNHWTVGDSPQLLNSWGLSTSTEQLGTLHNSKLSGTLHWVSMYPPTGALRPQLLNSQRHSTVTKQLGTYTPQCWTVGDSTYSVQPPIGVRDTPQLLKSLAHSTLLTKLLATLPLVFSHDQEQNAH